ncbi:MAG: RnfABCDGE type electron transport complex subunit G [Treponema sp.]|nr:RnfABCDGE type electron transport complex subunit G [Treponema sp.]
MTHVIKPAISLFVIAALSVVAISVVYELTLEPIAERRRATQERTLREVLPKAAAFEAMPSARLSGSMVRVFEGLGSDGAVVGYVVELAPVGYSGEIAMMVGISLQEAALSGMRALRHSETPGLGSNIVKESFYGRFEGLRLAPLSVVRRAPGAGEIQAIASSTITTQAVVGAVNEAIEWFLAGGYR